MDLLQEALKSELAWIEKKNICQEADTHFVTCAIDR